MTQQLLRRIFTGSVPSSYLHAAVLHSRSPALSSNLWAARAHNLPRLKCWLSRSLFVSALASAGGGNGRTPYFSRFCSSKTSATSPSSLRSFSRSMGSQATGTGTPPGYNVVFLSAAGRGNVPLLQRLVKEVENGEGHGKILYSTLKTPKGENALHLAANTGTTATCRFLIEELEFDIHGTCDRGETPLFRAILGGNQLNTIFLIDRGAEVTKCNIFGDTPLHCAANSGPKETVELLIRKGADVNATSQRGTPLGFAARCGHQDVLKCLLDHNADPNPNISSFPLIAAMHGEPSPNIECMELLLKAGADPNRPSYLTAPLHFAASKLSEDTIRCLLKGGADPNMPDFEGYTPLERAALLDRTKVVELLFPVTSRIACYPDWSIRGVMKQVKSEEGMAPYKSKQEEVALFTKSKGREAFKKGNYIDAGNWYTEAVKVDLYNAKVLSNLSLCFAKSKNGESALNTAKICVGLEPGWATAHYRLGAAWAVLKDFKKAAEAFSQALVLDPGNEEIEKAYSAAQAGLN